MKSILNKLDEYILVVDYEGNIIDCNDKILSKLKYDYNFLYYKNIKSVVKCGGEILEEIINNKENFDITFLKSDKEHITFSCSAIKKYYNNKNCVFLICKNISDKYYKKQELEKLMDETHITMWIKDINSRYLYVSKHFKEYFEKEYNIKDIDVIGKTDFDLFSYEEALRFNNEDKYVISTMEYIKSEHRQKYCGKLRYAEVYRYPIKNDNGSLKYIVGIVKDVTAEKTLEVEIRKNHYNMSKIYELINKNKNKVNLNELLEDIIKDLSKHLNADGLSIFLYNKEKNVIIPKVKLGRAKQSLEKYYSIPISQELLDIYSNKSILDSIRHIDTMPKTEYLEYNRKHGLEYIGSYKISIDNEFIGLLNITYNKGNLPINNIDSFMKTICIEIGMLIKRFRLSQRLSKELKERKELEEELELFLSTATDLLAIIDEKGNIKKVNSKWTETLGWSEEELYSINLGKIIHPDDLEKSKKYPDDLKNKEQILTMIGKYISKDGSYKYLHSRSIFLEDKRLYIITAKDITKEKIEEEERKKLEESIKLESIKNEFFANISHEFKTPINIILGNMQLLNKNIEYNKIQYNKETNLVKYVDSIKQNSYRLLRLVNNLIDMTRIDTGFYNINLGNYDIVKVIEDITMSVTQYTEGKGIELIFDTNIEELLIACDPDKIERIMLNLLSNAIKYSSVGGKIFVDLKYLNNKVAISVKDSGIGISKEKIDLIFERFGQANNSLIDRCKGSGIGLSLVKSLVELHEGKIYVKSKEKIGSTFTFELPNRLIENKYKNEYTNAYSESKIEKCDIEFSEIYS